MKKVYTTPNAEKLEFNYTDVILTSASIGAKRHGDNGNGHGCKGDAIPSNKNQKKNKG